MIKEKYIFFAMLSLYFLQCALLLLYTFVLKCPKLSVMVKAEQAEIHHVGSERYHEHGRSVVCVNQGASTHTTLCVVGLSRRIFWMQ